MDKQPRKCNLTILPDELLNYDEEVRENALVKFIGSHNIDIIPVLQAIIKCDTSSKIKFIAKKALYAYKQNCFYLNQTRDLFFIESIKNDDDQRRFEKFLPYLLTISPYVAVAAISAGIIIDSPVLADYLRQFLDENQDKSIDRYLLFKIFRVLSYIGNSKDLLLLKKIAFNTKDNRLLAAYAEACSIIGNEKDLYSIVNLLLEKNSLIKSSALKSLKKFGSYKVIRIVKEMLLSDDPWAKEAAAFALSRLKDTKALPDLATLLSNNTLSVRIRAFEGIKLLAVLKNRDAIRIYKSLESLNIQDENFITTAKKWKSFSTNTHEASLENDMFNSVPEIREAAIRDIIKSKAEKYYSLIYSRLNEESEKRVLSQLLTSISILNPDLKNFEAIIPLLNHSDSRVRANAVEALASFKNIEIRELKKYLCPLFNDPSNRVKANILVALAQTNDKSLSQLLKNLCSSDRSGRMSAIYAITEINDLNNVPFLMDLVKISDPETSQRAKDALILMYCSCFSDKKSLNLEAERNMRVNLLTAGINPENLFNCCTSNSRKNFLSKIAADKALFDLSSDNPDIKTGALRMFDFINATQSIDRIKIFMDDPSQSVRYYARKALNSLGFFNQNSKSLPSAKKTLSETLELFFERLTSSDPAVRLDALDRIFHISRLYGIKKISDFLLENLSKEKSTFVLPVYLKQLGIICGKKAYPSLLPYLDHKDSRVRAFAIEAIQAIRDESCLDKIKKCLNDDDNRVRANAIMALYHYDPSLVLDALDKMIYSHHPWMKDSAIFAARILGGPKIVSTLFEAFKRAKSYELKIKLVRSIVHINDISIIRDALDFLETCKDRGTLLILHYLIDSILGNPTNLDMNKVFHTGTLKTLKEDEFGLKIDEKDDKNLKLYVSDEMIMKLPNDLQTTAERLNNSDESVKIKAFKELSDKKTPALNTLFKEMYTNEKQGFFKDLALYSMHQGLMIESGTSEY